jgi:hypothetical protein
MATQIDSDDAMGPTEVFELRGQVRMVPAPAVHQQQRRCAAPGFLIRERDAITPKSLHPAPPPDPCLKVARILLAGAPHGVSASGPRGFKSPPI